eukprot:CAMPEP_0119052768 /NCGR_PEP_ID=MMETSP1177-20130426/73951_1 /TAXON_ID=2985 /ORGANISM="Ochromonas sp, Strain CCMP1899" /LENGTH=144 /DNA_ID=CAMNT_0007032437 /DNA_START=602 /DNA_END=1036 /DNA_ORIENTATION=+
MVIGNKTEGALINMIRTKIHVVYILVRKKNLIFFLMKYRDLDYTAKLTKGGTMNIKERLPDAHEGFVSTDSSLRSGNLPVISEEKDDLSTATNGSTNRSTNIGSTNRNTNNGSPTTNSSTIRSTDTITTNGNTNCFPFITYANK